MSSLEENERENRESIFGLTQPRLSTRTQFYGIYISDSILGGWCPNGSVQEQHRFKSEVSISTNPRRILKPAEGQQTSYLL